MDAPQFVLPAGVTLLDEINLDQQNLLGLIKQSLPAFSKGLGDVGGDIGGFAKAMNFDELARCIEGISALRIVHFRTNEPTDAARLLPEFEAQVPDSKGWKRIIYSTEMMEPAIVAAYSQGGKSYLGMMLNGRDDSFYIGTVGFVDLAKLASWMGRFLTVMHGGRAAALESADRRQHGGGSVNPAAPPNVAPAPTPPQPLPARPE